MLFNTNQIASKKVLLPNYSLKGNDIMSKMAMTPSVSLSFGEKTLNEFDNFTNEIKELEKDANNLGVKANYGQNAFLAKLFNEALTDVKNAGYKLPKKVEYGGDGHKSYTPAYYSKGVIYLNPKYDWDELKENTEIAYSQGREASDNIKHRLYHEIGHALHARTSPITFYIQMACPTPMTMSEKMIICSEVSSYATESVFDFVAEVFAGRMSGKAYSETINELYNQLGGPKPIKRK